jgi:hypothetical protein
MRSQPERFREVWSDGNVTVFENLRVLPRAFLVPQSHVEVIAAETGQLARLRDAAFDPLRSVIVPTDFGPRTSAIQRAFEPESIPLIVTKYEEGRNWVRVEANAPVPSVLVLNQIYYPGWSADVDGRKAPLLRTNYAFTGTLLDAGTHVIEFRFLPASFVLGLTVSAVSVLLAGVVIGVRKTGS